MKNTTTALLISLLTMGNIFAQVESPTFEVFERSGYIRRLDRTRFETNKTIIKEVQLSDLESSTAFDGKYFKIVKGKSNDAISFNDDDKEVIMRAANVYHHLTRARNFWINEVNSEAASKIPKLVIRIDITNQFDEQGHYANDKKEPQYNNALSIPAGKTPSFVPADKKDKWGKEIWFRPMKKVDIGKLADALGENPVTLALKQVEKPFINYTQNTFIQSSFETLFYPTYAEYTLLQNVGRFVGTIALTKSIIYASKFLDGMFVEKWYYLDTAMIPEVIYHEYSHIALSDTLELSHSTPVVEGMADYFAAVLSGKRKVYNKIKGHSNSAPKDTQNKRTYVHWDESNRNATADFALSVLWDVRDILGQKYGDEVVYEARNYLKTKTATLQHHLIRALIDACEKKCEKPKSDKYLLREAFGAKGF